MTLFFYKKKKENIDKLNYGCLNVNMQIYFIGKMKGIYVHVEQTENDKLMFSFIVEISL